MKKLDDLVDRELLRAASLRANQSLETALGHFMAYRLFQAGFAEFMLAKIKRHKFALICLFLETDAAKKSLLATCCSSYLIYLVSLLLYMLFLG